LLSQQPAVFTFNVEKSVFSIIVFIRVAFTCIGVVLFSSLIWSIYQFMRGSVVSVWQLSVLIVQNNLVQGCLVIYALINLRQVMFRLNDRKVD
jgi:hypothetical protein